ncbi:hypothetical protein [Leptotrichia hongkongensis]|uniref:hypothetical protein n=1 Tax=Leptotrichia hongkongensis TaxID=554406 RepID=UPI0035A898C3
MKYLIRVKITLLMLSILFLTNSCIEMYCVLSDDGGSFCSEVRMRADEREEKREEKRKEREHRKKMEEMNKNKE